MSTCCNCENISSSVLNRLIKEVKEYTKTPVQDIALLINEENFTDLRAELRGPAETPYEGGAFQMKLVFGPDFPSAPPKGFFITPIFHPNVAKNGEICVNTLKKDWKSDCKLSHILMVVRCLLIEPNPESALNEEAGRMFMEDYQSYSQRARLMTKEAGRMFVEDYQSYSQRARLMTKIHAATDSKGCESVFRAEVGENGARPEKVSKTGKGEEKKAVDKKKALKRL
ncbi:ubiquitin-conjugating enzyme/RWD-like protein [Baffinella frigidus]|nr:ubiquitin-conjugating enzyme/RWD-like protein [Cryptophyta sp. CCMP2293]